MISTKQKALTIETKVVEGIVDKRGSVMDVCNEFDLAK